MAATVGAALVVATCLIKKIIHWVAKLISGKFIEDNPLYVTMITSNVPYIRNIVVNYWFLSLLSSHSNYCGLNNLIKIFF